MWKEDKMMSWMELELMIEPSDPPFLFIVGSLWE
jgi:hypothetical protein